MDFEINRADRSLPSDREDDPISQTSQENGLSEGYREDIRMQKAPCCHKTKERTAAEYRNLVNRLSRIEGQIRGIRGMLERDAYCPDILVQVAAAKAALHSFAKELLGNHIRICVVRDIRDGKDETIDELLATLQKLMK